MTDYLHASRPAVHPRAIVIFTDATYIPYSAWTGAGLLREGAGAVCDVVVLSHDRAGLDLIAAAHPEIRCVEIAESFAPFGFADVPEDFPTRSFLNLFAPHIFEGEYDRLILCDADYVIGSPDMPRLFELNLKTYPLAAMRDIIGIHPDYAEASVGRYYEPAGIPITTPYLNGGFQVIDSAGYLGEEIGERALASTLARGGPKYLGDQRALNAVLRGDWMELSPNCNWAAVWPEQNPVHAMVAARALRPCGLHLLGAAKPWSTRRPRRIDPDTSDAMRAWFDASPWPGLIPPDHAELARTRSALAGLLATGPDPRSLFAPRVLSYLQRRFEDRLQGLAPGLDLGALTETVSG